MRRRVLPMLVREVSVTDCCDQNQARAASPHWSALTDLASPQRRMDVQANEMEGEVVLFDPCDGRTYHFNETAFRVWSQCDGATGIEQIGRTLTDRYDTPYDTAVDHVDQLVTVFAETGLLEPEANA